MTSFIDTYLEEETLDKKAVMKFVDRIAAAAGMAKATARNTKIQPGRISYEAKLKDSSDVFGPEHMLGQLGFKDAKARNAPSSTGDFSTDVYTSKWFHQGFGVTVYLSHNFQDRKPMDTIFITGNIKGLIQ
jgi:hypothetical protein